VTAGHAQRGKKLGKEAPNERATSKKRVPREGRAEKERGEKKGGRKTRKIM